MQPLSTLDSVGINIHFTSGHEKELDMIAIAGIKVVRTDLLWEKIERYQGIYDWSEYDELATNLAKRGLRPYFILDYSNALHEESARKLWQGAWPYAEVISPQHPRSIAAFSNWAAAAARHYKKFNVILEIWNEPNAPIFWKPTPNVADYSRLVAAACQAIRTAEPTATVIAPAAAGIPWDFLEGFFKTGALNCLDGVSVHPYRVTIPESVQIDYVRLRKLIDQYAPSSRKEQIPILSGEWGYTTVRRGWSLQDQANFAVRMQLINLLNGIPLSIWYDWKNDGQDPNSAEHNFGIVGDNLAPKPAYNDLKMLTTQLNGYHLVRRLPASRPDDYILQFANSEAQNKFVVWTSGWPHNTRFPAPELAKNQQMTLIDGFGLRSAIQHEDGWINVPFSPSPAYIVP